VTKPPPKTTAPNKRRENDLLWRLHARRHTTSPTAVTGNTGFKTGRAAALFAGAVIVRVVVAALPEGVTVAGLNAHEAPAGNPEQAKLTAALNPFCGVIVSVVVPVPPALSVSELGEAANVKLGGGRLIVYVADATALVE
jgi:hypothetical protein